jgi:hypothetical protein
MLEQLTKFKIMLYVNKIMWHGVWTMNHYAHILISTKSTLIFVYDNELNYFELILTWFQIGYTCYCGLQWFWTNNNIE